MKQTIISILITALFTTSAFGSTLVVTSNADSGIGSLRQAISDAQEGDIITFDQVYTIYLQSQLELGDKSLTVNGEVGDQKVKLDGGWADENEDWEDDDESSTRIFYIESTQDDVKIELKNLVIQNASTFDDDWGGAWGALPRGAGLFIDMEDGGELNVSGCVIENNVLKAGGFSYFYDTSGAGIFSIAGGSFVNCIIRNNIVYCQNDYSVTACGAGVAMLKGGVLTNCWIVGNSILCDPHNNENFMVLKGGGMYVGNEGDIEIQSCVVMGNQIKKINDTYNPKIGALGGGILLSSSKLLNSTIALNGIYNITPSEDESVMFGGVGILEYENTFIVSSFQNCLVYENISSGTINDCHSDPETSKYIAISDAEDFNKISDNNGCILLESSPFKEDPSSGTDGEWGTDDDDDGDLRLVKGSVCIDAGNSNSSEFDYCEFDIYSRTRINNNIIDIGASESTSEDFSYNLSGNVWADGNLFNDGKVYAMNKNNPTVVIDDCDLGDDGSFDIDILIDGEYYLLAEPTDDSNYLSTYFGNETDISSAISINVYSSIRGIDITLVENADTSLGDEDGVGIKIYPNPASEILYLQGLSVTNQVSIYNNTGVLVLKLKGNVNQIPVNQLDKGIYIIKIEVNDGCISRRFIKK